MPAMMRTPMLANMRDHLTARREIQARLAGGDCEVAADVAEKRLDMRSLQSHGASRIAGFMPKGMQQTGTAMHQAASRFAIISRETAVARDLSRALGALSRVTAQCVACPPPIVCNEGVTMRILLAPLLCVLALGAPAVDAFQPKAEKVAANVYALIGPLGQRSEANDGLNANYGFVVTPQGVILIDSGASVLGAKKLEAAIREVTKQPVRWVINTGSQDHRWLGNDYFAAQGAEVVALVRTAATQAEPSMRPSS